MGFRPAKSHFTKHCTVIGPIRAREKREIGDFTALSTSRSPE